MLNVISAAIKIPGMSKHSMNVYSTVIKMLVSGSTRNDNSERQSVIIA